MQTTAEPSGPGEGNGYSLLIVDDEPQVALELAEAMQDEGYRVHVVHAAADALALVQTRPEIAVMISDVRMPECDGLALTSRALALRGDETALEVILITGHATLDDAISAVRIGAFDFVRKPFRLQEVFDAASRAMARATGRRSVAAAQGNLIRQSGLPDHAAPSNAMALRGLMHELRNPLVPVLGYAELLEAQSSSPPDVRDKAREIIRGANQLVGTVNNMLTLALVEQGAMAARLEDCDLLAVAGAAVAAAAERGALKGVTLEIAPGDWTTARADPDQLSRAVCIGLDIAVELAPRSGRVTLRHGPRDAGAGLSIEADWGVAGTMGDASAPDQDAWPLVEQVAPLSGMLAMSLLQMQGGRLTLTRGALHALRAEFALPG
jgi:FixJ family two-component response regulator